MYQRFGPLSRAGSLFNALFTGGIGSWALARFIWAEQPLPLYFPVIAVLFMVFAVIAIWAWSRYYSEGSFGSDRNE